MSAHVVCPRDREWPIIRRFLLACRQGAIVISPHARQQFIDVYGQDPAELELIDYGFGGEPDVAVDFVRSLDEGPLAWDAIRQTLAIPDAKEPIGE